MAWAGVAVEQYKITKGSPGRYTSSSGVEQTFCQRCGTSLTQFAEEFSGEIYVSVCALDDPTTTEPAVHIWRLDRLPWFEIADNLPRYNWFKSDDLFE